MTIRIPVLHSTLEHVQLAFEQTSKFIAASIRLDTKNLTKDEIVALREALALEPITEWYPKIMREVVLWETFTPKPSPEKVQAVRQQFGALYQQIVGDELRAEWWTDKQARPKQNGNHAKAWAAQVVAALAQPA